MLWYLCAKICTIKSLWWTVFLVISSVILFSLFKFFKNLLLAALGLRCCARAFSSCGEWRLLFIVVRGLLIAVASLVVEHGL